ncbi:transcriptional repressor [Pontibacter sp. 172403-2]|uniref:Fur family transcriptional regulator n=1 Tax=Pontibacter rufus TaxID=2791028 RepID=UPI0018AFCAC1|nr:transcriptional repressor [Pontibacter sp. 172403-2]MBF9252224.1 transcriptional repressor [Pontibacter sp. 172403-2]
MLEKLEEVLKQRHIRPTAMRLLVLETLTRQLTAISLKDIEATFEQADRITLYRTLKTFEEKGLVHRVIDGTGLTKYALCEEGCVCAPQDLHVHFYCNACKETYCLPKLKVPDVQLPSRFQLEEVSLVVKGICDRCAT